MIHVADKRPAGSRYQATRSRKMIHVADKQNSSNEKGEKPMRNFSRIVYHGRGSFSTNDAGGKRTHGNIPKEEEE